MMKGVCRLNQGLGSHTAHSGADRPPRPIIDQYNILRTLRYFPQRSQPRGSGSDNNDIECFIHAISPVKYSLNACVQVSGRVDKLQTALEPGLMKRNGNLLL